MVVRDKNIKERTLRTQIAVVVIGTLMCACISSGGNSVQEDSSGGSEGLGRTTNDGGQGGVSGIEKIPAGGDYAMNRHLVASAGSTTMDASGGATTGGASTTHVTVTSCPALGGPAMVILPLGYCIDSTEVTRAQYAAWLDANPSTRGQISACSWNDSFEPRGDWPPTTNPNYPVVYVDWCDAFAFCEAVGKRLCGKIGGGFANRRDFADETVSQWFAACSSNGTYSYTYGDTSAGATCNDSDTGNAGTVAVGTMTGCQSPAAEFSGVYDLNGNVREWEDACDSLTIGEQANCTIRGGGYGDDSDYSCGTVSSTARFVATSYIGFRCCAP